MALPLPTVHTVPMYSYVLLVVADLSPTRAEERRGEKQTKRTVFRYPSLGLDPDDAVLDFKITRWKAILRMRPNSVCISLDIYPLLELGS